MTATAKNGGALLIPSFAVGRAQALQLMLTTLMKDGRVPTMPIYLGSPMAINVSIIYYCYTELHRLNCQQYDAMCNTINFVNHVEESKPLADIHFPSYYYCQEWYGDWGGVSTI